MKEDKGLDTLLLIGTRVKVTTGCPYYRTFPVKTGKLVEVLRDSVGKLYQVELDSGDLLYLRRAEIEPVSPEFKNIRARGGNGKKVVYS